MVKQVILLRTDLNMRKGKMSAQAAHASMKVFFDRGSIREEDRGPGVDGPVFLTIDLTDAMEAWVRGAFTKIVLGVESEADLLKALQLARERGIPSAIIQDAGATEFHGVPTFTAVAIGPCEAEKIDEITGKNGLVSTKLL